ncbi:hypothetical protein Pelo_19677 [Pelomyxa schiedti]|nr:hypothetical protein Pelo_19677 [Pelomyxa schiedti]
MVSSSSPSSSPSALDRDPPPSVSGTVRGWWVSAVAVEVVVAPAPPAPAPAPVRAPGWPPSPTTTSSCIGPPVVAAAAASGNISRWASGMRGDGDDGWR